jgi:hypothetical protein
VVTEHALSVTRGGPFYHLLRHAHLTDATGKPRALWLAAFVWIPFAVGSLIDFAIRGAFDPVSTDLSVHVRLLVMLPLMVAAENLLEERTAAAAHHAIAEKIAPRTSLEAIFGRATRLREAWQPEALFLVLVVVVGQVWLRSSWAGIHHGAATFTRAWCFCFALPLVQFIVVRWLWHWALWTYVLVRLAGLRLSLDALHPDRAAGLRILSSPVDAFAMFVGAIMAMVAASWWERIYAGVDTLKSLSPQWVTFFVVAVVVACGPLLLFSRQLYRARHRDATAYHVLAREYAEAFREKWLAPHGGHQVLGTSDIQSLSDLGNSYHAAEDTRIYVFDVRTLLYLAVGAGAPMIPVALATSPITEVATHLGKMLFGVAA